MGKDEELIQGSNKFRDKREKDRVNGQSKATDEVESECEGQQRRVRQQEMTEEDRSGLMVETEEWADTGTTERIFFSPPKKEKPYYMTVNVFLSTSISVLA